MGKKRSRAKEAGVDEVPNLKPTRPEKKKKVEDGGVHIDDCEHEIIVKALENVDWKEVVNTGRKNVIDPEKAPRDGRGKPYCRSFILGPNMKDPERKPSYWTEKNPKLWELLCNAMQRHDPDHKFTNITVNMNFRCKPHRDRGNTGKSYIIGFGNYKGGELFVGPRDPLQRTPPDEKPKDAEPLDIFRRFTPFYGCEQTHWVKEFSGERYTCVFYNFPELHEKGKLLQKFQQPEITTTDKKVASALQSKLDKFKERLKKSKKK